MREIKFRAWNSDSKKMFDVTAIEFKDCYLRSFTHREETVALLVGPGDEGQQENWESSPIMMQFTGLRDKNGKEIYEGDIVRQTTFMPSEFKPKIYFVSYWDSEARFMVSDSLIPPSMSIGLGNLEHEEKMRIEVIGNIYENPELLKEMEK